jgi:hypothetical protein
MWRNKLPEVNLLAHSSGRRLRTPPRLLETSLIVVVLAIWGIVGVAVAMLLGWQPPLGLGQ